ncbi:glucose-1-phosphate cytidylyltransferase [Paenibacillus algorifonticola]|uniref:Glucose-1-phosphate cytidylyltransferase n=1 Tax=Paenibacillus algorifonticola TaxID=684063 RepID=A0A1I2IBH6_9BACL|nr:glucose-1-phosphate cytidylyltransferase [Paenibacillus algorifonticola]SFF39645.1 glucose-1-phosphate cytidylyltransferase [Paenibacillus algorifonticola]
MEKTKVVLLSGGFGTRLGEETMLRPKPMVEIGGMPILCHIMNIYDACGFNEFIIALGYKKEMIKQYFLNYMYLQNDFCIHMGQATVDIVRHRQPDWTVHLLDTGLSTMTGGRLHRLRDQLCGDTFMTTYGDGVGDIDVKRLLDYHRSHGKLATVTLVKPRARFGTVDLMGDQVVCFKEKADTGGWINGGFFVFEPGVLDYIGHDTDVLESDVLPRLAEQGQLMAYRHDGFWDCMDTMRDKQYLESLWASGEAPWKRWRED